MILNRNKQKIKIFTPNGAFYPILKRIVRKTYVSAFSFINILLDSFLLVQKTSHVR